MLMMACGMCATRTVQITGALEVWHREDGPAKQFVTGRCTKCNSVQLFEPSDTAVERATQREQKNKTAMRMVAGD